MGILVYRSAHITVNDVEKVRLLHMPPILEGLGYRISIKIATGNFVKTPKIKYTFEILKNAVCESL